MTLCGFSSLLVFIALLGEGTSCSEHGHRQGLVPLPHGRVNLCCCEACVVFVRSVSLFELDSLECDDVGGI